MANYDVTTEDLLGIRDQWSGQALLLGNTRSVVTAATTTMVGQVDGGFSQAQIVIDGLLGDLIGLVVAADDAAKAADWLGPDAQIFRAANADLTATIDRSRTTLESALIDHRAATTQLGQTLASTLEVFAAEAGRSAELSAQLSAAVGAEADSYERAFNGSWAIGIAGQVGAGVGDTANAEVDDPVGDVLDWIGRVLGGVGIGLTVAEWAERANRFKPPAWAAKLIKGGGRVVPVVGPVVAAAALGWDLGKHIAAGDLTSDEAVGELAFDVLGLGLSIAETAATPIPPLAIGLGVVSLGLSGVQEIPHAEEWVGHKIKEAVRTIAHPFEGGWMNPISFDLPLIESSGLRTMAPVAESAVGLGVDQFHKLTGKVFGND